MIRHIAVDRSHVCDPDVFGGDDIVHCEHLHGIISAVKGIQPLSIFSVGDVKPVLKHGVFVEALIRIPVRHHNLVLRGIHFYPLYDLRELTPS